MTLAPTMSEVLLPPSTRKLDPRTATFRSQADKDEFLATLPTAIQLQLNQKFGKDNLNQSFYLQKTGSQAMLLLYKSGFMTNTVKKKLESAFPPARQLRQLMKKYEFVDFRSIQGFQPDWKTQTVLSRAQRDMTTACLLHFLLSLPAMVRWIAGPHVGEHRDNKEIFARLKPTCADENFQDLVRVFTKGSPTYVNAECSQANYRAFRDYGNHSSFDDNPAMVDKTLLKDVSRGNTLMIDPALLDFIENIKITPHGIVHLDHPYKNPRVVCDATHRPHYWCFALNDWTNKTFEPSLIFPTAFVQTLVWIWNLRVTYPTLEIYICDDDITNAFRQAKYPPNLAGLHCKIFNGVLFIDTGQTFGDTTSPANFEPIAICRSQHARALWHRDDTVKKTLHLLPKIEYQTPPTPAEVDTFVQANRDSMNQGVLDENGNRQAPLYRHHVDDNLYADIAEHLDRTVCASALALYEILGFPDDRQIGALSMEKLDTSYGPQRKIVGYQVNTRSMTVALLQYKRNETADLIDPWLTCPTFTLLQAAELCGKLESVSTCNRWIRPYFFSVQNTIRAALTMTWKKVQAFYRRKGMAQVKAKYQLPKNLERRLAPLIARDKAMLLWHSRAVFNIPLNVTHVLTRIQASLRDTSVKWEKSIAHWIPRDPTFISAGDASQIAGGGISVELQFWFDVYWSDSVRHGCQLPPMAPGYIHINSLEFIVVLIQLAASIVALEVGHAQSIYKGTIPDIPLLSTWTDNTASKSWSNRVTTSSRTAQPLVGILSNLLRRNNIGFESKHIAGVDNDLPDFISRPDRAAEPALSHHHRSLQIITHDSRLKHWHYFRPSPAFTSLLASSLFSRLSEDPPNLPKNLGHFERTVCIGSPFVSI